MMNGKPVFSVPAKTVINWESGFGDKLLCDGLTFSTGTACVFSCAFCYVPDMMRKLRSLASMAHVTGQHEDIVIRREGAVAALIKQLESPRGRALAEKDLVIYASPSVDVAGNMELVRETVECCEEILRRTYWTIRLLSKSPLLVEVAKGLEAWNIQQPTSNSQHPIERARERVIYGLSTGTLDDGLAKCIEGGAPRVSKRLAALHWLQNNGFRTFGMVCPSLPQEDYARFAREMAAAIRAERCEHVWAEVMNVRGESFTRTIAALQGGGFRGQAELLQGVMGDKALWEEYARTTFLAHFGALPAGKLRFLQYVDAGSREWWEWQRERGAVVL